MANPGDLFTYTPDHGNGYGHNAKGQELTAEMTELDLKPGTQVRFLEYDADSLWPLVEWVDDQTIDRITTIEPDSFTNDFVPL
jgi:plastocyanin